MSRQDNPAVRRGGKYERPKRKRISFLALALIFLGLLLSRFGAELFKLYAYADLMLNGSRMLIYGDVKSINLGRSLNGERLKGLDSGEITVIDDGTTVEYNGHTYTLNRDLATVLLLGIDRTALDQTISGRGGQSDVVMLVGLDTSTGEATVLNISREAYAQIQVYATDGNYVETIFGQLAMAYGYGNGRELSCENAIRSVSYLLYMLPIQSYLAMDMDGLIAANETLGGISLKSLSDINMPDGTKVKQGELIELHGANAERYIRTRGVGLDSNGRRMERQKQYLTEFIKKAIQRSKQNLTFPVDLFTTLSPYTVTNLTIPDVTFLSNCFLKNSGNFTFRSISGTYGLLNGSAVLYLDETDLFEAVLQMFYKQVS